MILNQQFLQGGDLFEDAGFGGAAGGRAHLNRLLVVEGGEDVFLETLVDALEVGEGHFVHWRAGFLGEGHALARDVMSIWYSVSIVCEVLNCKLYL